VGSRQFLMSILPKLCIVPSALRPLNASEPSRTRALDVGKSKYLRSIPPLTNFPRGGRRPSDLGCFTSLMHRCCYPRACGTFDTKGYLRRFCMEGHRAPSIRLFDQICYFYPETAPTIRSIRPSPTTRHLGSYRYVNRRSTRRIRRCMVSVVSA
jgi:hypothetical protein